MRWNMAWGEDSVCEIKAMLIWQKAEVAWSLTSQGGANTQQRRGCQEGTTKEPCCSQWTPVLDSLLSLLPHALLTFHASCRSLLPRTESSATFPHPGLQPFFTWLCPFSLLISSPLPPLALSVHLEPLLISFSLQHPHRKQNVQNDCGCLIW